MVWLIWVNRHRADLLNQTVCQGGKTWDRDLKVTVRRFGQRKEVSASGVQRGDKIV